MRHPWLPLSLLILAASPLPAQERGIRPDSTRQLAQPADTVPDTTAAPLTLPGVLGDFAELGMRVQGRGELGGAWSRFDPCDPTLQLNCNPTLFPLLRPEVEFSVQVAGTVSDRIHIDVDYDQRREFDATNNINVYYQGLPGEILQRIELGDVSIRLPASRYLTQGVPSGNFGFKAEARLGPLDVQSVWAQRSGDVAMREFRLGGGLDGLDGMARDASVVLDDADYVQGQFFFLVDPEEVAGYPHIDALDLRGAEAPAELRPARGTTIHLYRDERPSSLNPQQQAQLGYFLAEARTADGTLRHSGRFRRLVPGEDYLVHGSGLWLVLRAPLRHDEALAVAYLTETGEPVGELDAERAPAGTVPELRLLRGPVSVHHPGQPTWRHEMRQVYRIDGSSDVETGSIDLQVSLGQAAAGATYTEYGGRRLTYLRLFGMDEDAPAERLDAARIFRPADLETGLLGAAGRFGGTYIVFPTLAPFAEPPPLASEALDADETRAALGADANPAIYDHPDPVYRRSAGRFRLNIEYRVRTDGMVSSFDLGAFGIREGSERITVDGRPLERDVDYTIDYALGHVTLLRPQAIHATSPDAEIRASWEQQALFDIAPTTLFGLNARLDAGEAGGIDFLGLYQAERTLTTRPRLGMEPASIMLGGMSGGFELRADWLDRIVERLPGPAAQDATSTPASRLRIGGELALSMPEPNREGLTYVDDFESSDEFRIALDRALWHLGSRPDDPIGATTVLPPSLDVTTATSLVWQHDILDDAGRVVGPLQTQAIDRQINVAGAQRAEPVFYLTFGDGTVPRGERRWRSVTTVLETTGRDMSRSEFLEFYAASPPGRELTLILDVGAVGEDAFYFDGEGRTSGVYPDGRPWGLGILDEEARTGEREIWGADLDTLGLWNQDCRALPGQQAFPLGDPRANCTRGNGLVDTEDLDGNGILDAHDGALFRYVIRLDATSPYRVRGPSGTGTDFSLYRIPLRGPGAVPIGGATEATWSYIKHLRLTVAGDASGPRGATVRLARMRIVGSRWTKRDVHGIARGIYGDEPGQGTAATRFRVGPVSRVTDGESYSPPPGVVDQLDDPSSAYGGMAVEYNEKALRLAYDDLYPGDRAEAFYRYPQQPRNFLNYRELRVWALARAGRWGVDGDERLIVSVGTDPRNRYLYRSPLRPARAGPAHREDWLPELVIDFEPWFELKALAEQALIAGEHEPGEPVVIWNAAGTHAVVMEDRARAPNLAAVRELAFAVHNEGGLPAHGEVWINDVRLGRGTREPGVAGHLDLELSAGDFATAAISWANRGANFRQDSRESDFRASNDVTVGGTFQLGRLAPARWGIEAPVTVSHARTGIEPLFLEESDVRADRLPGLRETGAERTRIAVALRRVEPSASPWLGPILDATSLRLAYQTASTRAARSLDESRAVEAGLAYDSRPAAREVELTPEPVEDILRALVPDALHRADFFRRLLDARLRWNPETIVFTSAYADRTLRTWRYGSILADPADADITPVEAPRQALESTARVELRPIQSLRAGLDLTTSRDLLDPERAVAQPWARDAIERARNRPGGVDLGWETGRGVDSRLDYRPPLAAWIRPSVSFTGRFRTDRNPSYWELEAVDGDTTAVLRRAIRGERQLTRSVVVDPAGLGAALAEGTLGPPTGARRAAIRIGRALTPIDLSWNDAVGSRFDWEAVEPGLRYQLGLGGADRFRVVDGDTAASASTRSGFRARGGVRIPTQATLEIAYDDATAEVHDLLGGDRTLSERAWPDLRLAWTDLPVPGFLREHIVHGALSIGYRASHRSTRYGEAGHERASEERRLPLHFSIGLVHGLTASYAGSIARGHGHDPTGATEEREHRHDARISGNFLAPSYLRESLPQPIRATVLYGEQLHWQCRVAPTASATSGASTPTDDAPCTPFIDTTHRQLGITLDTRLAQLTVGFQASYNQSKSRVGLRSGSSQFQMGLYGEFDFAAGTALSR